MWFYCNSILNQTPKQYLQEIMFFIKVYNVSSDCTFDFHIPNLSKKDEIWDYFILETVSQYRPYLNQLLYHC